VREMRGFFSKEKTQIKGGETKGFSCASCGLYKFALTPKMEPYGNFRKGIMVIGEAPGEDEDRRGRPWQGKTGRVLQRKYAELGVDLFEDCISLNAVACHPTNKRGANRTPTNQEVACCRAKVLRAIKRYQPKLIILQGNIPTLSLIGGKWKGNFDGISKWRGWTIPDREFGAWICPTFHPSFIERQEEESEAEIIWTQDLKQAFSKLDDPFPNYKDEEECITVTDDIDSVLDLMSKPGLMAFDIETTGLKPYDRDRHQIVSISFCNDLEKAYATPFPTDRKHLRKLKALLENPKVGKIAANMKYENNWLDVFHGIQVNPWKFDTMQAAHILDNRPGITGLKFQAYVRYGLLGYEDEIKPYLTSKGSNEPNRILELISSAEGLRKLRVYNGIDSLMEYRLALDQMKELGMKWDS
jgi:uracil-DNA glycosylase family 4